jgi:MoaA/NifB/PqqE/SkfB family radical SAM enzyme
MSALKLTNASGQRRAAIPIEQLDDLWFMWSRCNLSCTHCYVGSNPHNDTLQMITLEEARPVLREAVELGVSRIYFTGGEPFIHPEIMPLIQEAAEVAPVTVLTNATKPIEKHIEALLPLKARLTLRISLDDHVEERHDAIRGAGTYARTVRNTRHLAELGFRVIVTVTPVVFEGTSLCREDVEAEFAEMFTGDVSVKIIAHTLGMGAEVERSGRTDPDFFLAEAHLRDVDPGWFQCHNGRAVQKIDGELRVYPCPIIYDDVRFDLGGSLRESLQPVHLAHPACYAFCYRGRGSCTDDARADGI